VYRPLVMGTRGMVAAGHYIAAHVGAQALAAGGNAVDAGVTAGIALNVLHPDMTTFTGVAPIMIHLARERRTLTISGLGRWPRAATLDLLNQRLHGHIQDGVLCTVIPAAADAWLTALERYGTFTAAQALAPAVEIAAHGFPVYGFMRSNLLRQVDLYRRWPSTAEIFLPGGRVPEVGEIFVQRDAAATLRRLIEAERAAGGGSRARGVRAARDAFYHGELARRMADFARGEGGLLTEADLADFHVQEEAPVLARYREYEVWGCGPWCQGPVLGQVLQILEAFDLRGMGWNSPDYIHTVTEAVKLAMADREHYVGDPEFVPVPVDGMMSRAYARDQSRRIDPARAFPGLPRPGDPWRYDAAAWRGHAGAPQLPPCTGPAQVRLPEPADAHAPAEDTSYVAVVDRDGNCFSATPSDPAAYSPVVPGLGLPLSSRARQSRLEAGHPAVAGPWRRPRLTPMPVIIFRRGRPWACMGTPGGDVQPQAMAQVFLNMVEFGMNPQDAVEAPRFATFSFPNSFYPHTYEPGVLRVEGRIPEATRAELAVRGHRVQLWPDWEWEAGAVLAVVVEEGGLLQGAADPRREGYAIGW
jgi:gamma-glutamyltranspeptidase/glutathione hydrolase